MCVLYINLSYVLSLKPGSACHNLYEAQTAANIVTSHVAAAELASRLEFLRARPAVGRLMVAVTPDQIGDMQFGCPVNNIAVTSATTG